jgi:hypothetical protein
MTSQRQQTVRANLLVHVSGDSGAQLDRCLQQLSSFPPAETNVLVISYTTPVEAWVSEWAARAVDLPAELCIAYLSPNSASCRTSQTGEPLPTGGELSVITAHPSDLTGLGIRVTEQLKQWSGNGYQTVLYVDSLTPPLMYTDLETVFRFLHVLTSQVRAVGGIGYYHLDPASHGSTVQNTLTQLFDRICE